MNKPCDNCGLGLSECKECEIYNGYIPIPKGATNGDILEMIFPQMKVEKMGTLVELVENGVPKIGLNDDFWNARYTEGFSRKELEK